MIVAAVLALFALRQPRRGRLGCRTVSEHVQRFNREYNSTGNLEDARNTFVNAFKIVLLFEVKADGYIGIDNLGK